MDNMDDMVQKILIFKNNGILENNLQDNILSFYGKYLNNYGKYYKNYLTSM